MPAYDYSCPGCRSKHTLVRRVADRDARILCDCGQGLVRKQVYPVKLGGVGFKEYRSPATGRVIDSPTKERDELARTGCFIDEPGVVSQIQRRRKQIEEESDAHQGVLIEKLYGELEACGKGLD